MNLDIDLLHFSSWLEGFAWNDCMAMIRRQNNNIKRKNFHHPCTKLETFRNQQQRLMLLFVIFHLFIFVYKARCFSRAWWCSSSSTQGRCISTKFLLWMEHLMKMKNPFLTTILPWQIKVSADSCTTSSSNRFRCHFLCHKSSWETHTDTAMKGDAQTNTSFYMRLAFEAYYWSQPKNKAICWKPEEKFIKKKTNYDGKGTQ